MRVCLVSFLLAVLCAGAYLVPQPTLAETAQQPRKRDVLASAFTYPFLTDAEIDVRFDDTRGRIVCRGGPVLFRYPGISGVRVEGREVEAHVVGRDLLRAELAAGVHEIAILTGGSAPAAPMPAPAHEPIATAEAFQRRADHLQPGEELVVADGIYTDWRVRIEAQGTARAPILIRAETPGGVIFRRNSRFSLRGRHLVLKGFRFDHVGPRAVMFERALQCRMTQCTFSYCGDPTNMFAHIVYVSMGSHRNRIDHCFFTGSKSMSVGQAIRDVEGVGRHNRYDRNIFRDIFRYWINGQEPIQLGQNQARFGDARPETLVEFNLFDHAWGDSEIVSSKSSGNVLRYNVAAHCIRSNFTLRGGDETRFEGNVMVNNAEGVRPMGKRHVIVNNLFLDMRGAGILFSSGTTDGANVVATADALVAHNTFINGGGPAITAAPTSESRPFAPTGNQFINNIFVGTRPALLDTENLPESVVRRNLFWAGGRDVEGTTGEKAILADPRLEGEGVHVRPGAGSPALDAALPLAEVDSDRFNRGRPGGDGPDLGADERQGAPPAEPVRLPCIPPRPVLDPDLYTGEKVWAQDVEDPLSGLRGPGGMEAIDGEAQLTDVKVEVATDLPADYVLMWEYQPDTFAAAASLAFSLGEGNGYVLSWGGLTEDGLPAGVVELRKAGSPEVLADAADLVYYHQDFRDHAWGPGIRYTSDAPRPSRWYRFVVLKHEGRLIVLLHGVVAAQLVPVLVWEDDGVTAGPVPEGARLCITQSATGRWRDLQVWKASGDGRALCR